MTPLIVALPCHAGDVDQAEALLRWIKELGGVREHSFLLAADSALSQERVRALLDIVRGEFDSVRAMIVNVGVKGWPQAANLMWRAVARQVNEFYKAPWLWLEPDAVPLRTGWLSDIAQAYWRSPRPLLGCVLDAEREIEGLPARYLAGVAVYPQDLYRVLAKQWGSPMLNAPTNPKLSVAQRQQGVRAWDMLFADTLVARAHHTPLIQQFWGVDYNTPPLFVGARTEAHPVNAVTLDLVRKDAVLFHRVKDVEGFLALWRLRLEHAKALVVETAHKATGEASRNVAEALGPATALRPQVAERQRKAQEKATAQRAEPVAV
jgi:hypothetical protein